MLNLTPGLTRIINEGRMTILHLTLHKIWFDKIASGQKTDEYRKRSAYWQKRLEGKSYDEIHFRNGYATNAPWMRVECRGIETGQEEGQACYIIKLGAVLEIKNYNPLPLR